MCTDPTPPYHGRHVLAPPVLRDFEPPVMFDLEPVDAVAVTTLMDNVTDFSMPDQGPAHRATRNGGRRPTATMEDGWGLDARSEEHTSELQSLRHLVCRL